MQLARLAGECLFVTALGDDDLGHRAQRDLEALGVRVEAAWRPEPQRGERSSTWTPTPSARSPSWASGSDHTGMTRCPGLSSRISTPSISRPAIPRAVRAARAAGKLVSTVRAIDSLAEAQVQVDMLVASAEDKGERYAPGDLMPPPRFRRPHGGRRRWVARSGRWRHAAPGRPLPYPAPPADAYGAGDSFAAGLTYGSRAGPLS